jgi:hypothetical protein
MQRVCTEHTMSKGTPRCTMRGQGKGCGECVRDYECTTTMRKGTPCEAREEDAASVHRYTTSEGMPC